MSVDPEERMNQWVTNIGLTMVMWAEIEWEVDEFIRLLVTKHTGWQLMKRLRAIREAVRDPTSTLDRGTNETIELICDQIEESSKFRNIVAHNPLRLTTTEVHVPPAIRSDRGRPIPPEHRSIVIDGYLDDDKIRDLDYIMQHLKEVQRLRDLMRKTALLLESSND